MFRQGNKGKFHNAMIIQYWVFHPSHYVARVHVVPSTNNVLHSTVHVCTVQSAYRSEIFYFQYYITTSSHCHKNNGWVNTLSNVADLNGTLNSQILKGFNHISLIIMIFSATCAKENSKHILPFIYCIKRIVNIIQCVQSYISWN